LICIQKGAEVSVSAIGAYRVFSDNMLSEKKVSGVSNKKFQITKHKYQTNHNDRNSKFQTIDF